MDKIFNDAKDKNVAAVKVYVDTNNYACLDSAKSVKLTAEELEDAFVKGCVVVTATGYAIPTAYTAPVEDTAEYASITCGETTVYSKEYTPAPESSGGSGESLGS